MKRPNLSIRFLQRAVHLIIALGTASFLDVSAAADFTDANWTSMGGINGVNDTVFAAIADSQGNLYIGGGFTVVGDITASYIAKWNGTSWNPPGAGMGAPSGYSPVVYALAVSGDDVYAGGGFTNAGGIPANYIAKWNGSSWSALGSGMGGGPPGYGGTTVYSVAVSGTYVYAGGSFTTAGGVAANYVARWDGNSWTALGSGVNSPVTALAVSGDDVYAGGTFTTAGGSAATNIAKWNGSSWTPLGSGTDNQVAALAVSGSNVYVGGYFTMAGGVAANYIAKWNGSSWGSLGLGIGGAPPGFSSPSVYSLAVSGGDLYAGGRFTNAGGLPANYIAKWNGNTWSALDLGIEGAVGALAPLGSEVYAGGRFATAGGIAANYVAKWNGSTWSALGAGIGGVPPGYLPTVSALTVSDSDLYVGGFFTTVGGIAANYIARWNGSNWSPLGSGMSGGPLGSFPVVFGLAVSGGDAYAGGRFTNAGGTTANYIAKWDGSTWSALGLGMNSNVSALATSGSELYVGGDFSTAGGIAASYIAKWNGSAWSTLGSGMNNHVRALVVSGSELYGGGDFTTAGGSAANYIAKWDGSTWSALGLGMNNYVRALALSGSELYAGGAFTRATNSDGVAVRVNGIAKWNGSGWSALGLGINGITDALAVSGSDLYAGGSFTTAGGIAANFIAKWDGNSWSALGSGMSFTAQALAVSGSDIYAGGEFTMAGGKVSAYVAKWAPLVFRASSVTVSNGTFQAMLTGPDTNNVVVDSTATFTNWTPVATNILPRGGSWQLAFPIGTNMHQFYRARLAP
jgi:hypothetical protein